MFCFAIFWVKKNQHFYLLQGHCHFAHSFTTSLIQNQDVSHSCYSVFSTLHYSLLFYKAPHLCLLMLEGFGEVSRSVKFLFLRVPTKVGCYFKYIFYKLLIVFIIVKLFLTVSVYYFYFIFFYELQPRLWLWMS